MREPDGMIQCDNCNRVFPPNEGYEAIKEHTFCLEIQPVHNGSVFNKRVKCQEEWKNKSNDLY